MKKKSHHTSSVFLPPAELPAALALKITDQGINADVCTVLFTKFPLEQWKLVETLVLVQSLSGYHMTVK